ncbi:MAG: 4-alpha-glucanotransferase, partial [Clostridia bacterium]|nr:4-alpha-glucanotransferase [Clostridia bacterium]
VFSLPGKYGCGCFSKEAREFIDLIADAGFSLWQVLPFSITDSHGSPYMSASSFGGNPLFIDPEELYLRGLVTKAELEDQLESDPYLCDIPKLKKKRRRFISLAASRFGGEKEIARFFEARPETEATCAYMAKREAAHGADEGEALNTWRFSQYEFFRQWDALHAYALKKGVSVIGDLPFYVSSNSLDVLSAPEQFQLDPKGDPAFVAGVPPDYFSEDGQLWGNPLYDWDEMEKTGFGWWRRRLGYVLSLFDGVRIDHFRAISAYWSIPAGAKSAKEGRWIKGPGKKLTDALSAEAKGKMILAEDLGVSDEDTRRLLKESGFPGMAVFQFGFDGDPGNVHLPHNYPENVFAYTGTHDNNTLLGFWWELDENTRKLALEYLGNPADGCAATIRTLMMSRARTVIFPVQDLLGFGADTRINVPGRADGNWRYRLTASQMRSLDVRRFARMNEIYGRK